MPRTTDYRLVILHKNIHNILAQITGTVGNEGINISNLTNQSKGDFAVTILDVDNKVSDDLIVKVNGEKKFVARPGTIKDNICVKITDVYDEMHELLRNYF
jgi:flagellar motor switch protein FliM